MVTYKFYVKKGADLTKYGFKEDKKGRRFAYRADGGYGLTKLWVDGNNCLHTNMPNNDDLKVFMDMVLDGIIEAEKWYRRDKKPLQVYVTPEEKEMLEKWRSENDKQKVD